MPVHREGDVLRRAQIRMDEVRQSLSIIEQVLTKLPDGPIRVTLPPLPTDEVALGYVEGWRGVVQRLRSRDPGAEQPGL